MDQLKTFLRQCVKYRFWIAVGVSMLLPMTGYFLGSSAYTDATAKSVADIKATDTDVAKYTAPNPPNADYKRLVDEKKEVLSKDVDATQRKLYERQEPLLKWPEVVEAKFRTWGRKWPENTDIGQVKAVINDYTVAYPDFVTKVYQTLKPWNPEDGTGIVFAPDQTALLKPAPFTEEAPPDLTKVWSEQERLWVLTALLDVIAKVNGDAGAKDWDGAWIKQIIDIDVGSNLAQDQQSIAKGVALEPAPPLAPEGTPPPEPTTTGGSEGMMMGGGRGAMAASVEVMYLKSENPVPYKILPVQLTVLIDQNRLAEFMIALENSPMAIQVMEPEISKPTAPVVKPVYGESNYAAGGMMGGMGGMMGGMGEEMMGRGNSGRGQRGLGGMGAMGGMGGMGEAMMGMGMGRGGMVGSAAAKKGTDLRGTNRAADRKKAADAAKAKTAPKKGLDQYFNIVQLTIYGQARFYNSPAPIPPAEPSTAPTGEALPVATDAATAPPTAAATSGEAPTTSPPTPAGGAGGESPSVTTPAPAAPVAEPANPKS